MDDLQAVMDAAEVETAAFFGMSEGGPMSILFAATYPERVQSLALYGTMLDSPRVARSSMGIRTPEDTRAIIKEIENHWGEGALADIVLRARSPRSQGFGNSTDGFSAPEQAPR